MKGCRPLTPEEVQKVIAEGFDGPFASRNRLLFVLGVATGYRISELLSFRVKDIWDGERMRSKVTVPAYCMKGKYSNRTVEVPPVVEPYLRASLAKMGSDLEQPLFPSSESPSGSLSRWQARRVLHQAFLACELDGLTDVYEDSDGRTRGQLGTHCMRKTSATTRYRESGLDLMSVKEWGGWVNVNNTAMYIGLDWKKEDQLSDKVGELLIPKAS